MNETQGRNAPSPSPSPMTSQSAISTDPRIIHAQSLKSEPINRSFFNTLITLYSKSTDNFLCYSLRLFHQIPSPDVVSWTSLISAHCNSFPSLHYFISMLRHPTSPNQRTLASLFRTCASLSCLEFGRALHSISVKVNLSAEPFSGSALINFYAKCRLPNDAHKVFDEISKRDEVCYSAIIVGLAQNSKCIDALSVFADMKSRYFGSTMYSVSAALRATAELAALEQCRIIHAHAVVAGLNRNAIVGSALIDGYGKAGLVFDARLVFEENLIGHNIVAWNAMMAGYAQQGDTNSALELFNSMEARGIVPDEYSFLAVLTAFSNASLAAETEQWLNRMKIDYGLEPALEHYTCVIRAMGRAGRLEDAQRMAMTMPFEPDAALWRALLSTCAFHGAADMAWAMARQLFKINQHDDSAYVILANVLSTVGRHDEVAEVRKMMKDRRVKKEGGKSWIEVRGDVHIFLAGDRRHERTQEIYAKLAELMEKIEKLGYVPVWDEMLHEVGESEKKEALSYHSEKLALAFGVVSGAAPPGKAIRIVKNLTICKDCHKAFKYMSTILQREIIVRDTNRYHRFMNGSCQCGDTW